jgi:hypothetical protein
MIRKMDLYSVHHINNHNGCHCEPRAFFRGVAISSIAGNIFFYEPIHLIKEK